MESREGEDGEGSQPNPSRPPSTSTPGVRTPTTPGVGTPTFAEVEALADPTRYRIYRLLLDDGRARSVTELTDAVGVHHTAVRSHLRRLQAVGIVASEPSPPSGRGRPPTLYRATAPSTPHGSDTAYRRLSAMLAHALSSGISVREAGRNTGRIEAAAARAAEPGEDPLTALVNHTRRHGYEPELDAEHREIVLHRCPYAEVADADPATVCSLHLGIAEGIAEELGGMEVTGIDVNDPFTAGCRLRYTPVEPPRGSD